VQRRVEDTLAGWTDTIITKMPGCKAIGFDLPHGYFLTGGVRNGLPPACWGCLGRCAATTWTGRFSTREAAYYAPCNTISAVTATHELCRKAQALGGAGRRLLSRVDGSLFGWLQTNQRAGWASGGWIFR
jgi:hypothetical protein